MQSEENSYTAINETYKVWKKHVPFLYNILQTYVLSTPSQTVDWVPAQHIQNDWNIMHLLLGTNSLTRNAAIITTLGLPTRDAITDHSSYRDQISDTALGGNGYIGTMGLQNTTIKHSIPQASEIATARAHPVEEHLIAVKTGGSSPEYLLYDLRQPEEELQATAFRLEGHTEEGLALQWHPSQHSQIISGAFDKKILLHDIQKGVDAIREWTGGEVVEDVRWSQKNPALFGSVHQGRNMHLWDTRQAQGKPFLSVEAHNTDVYSLDFNYKSEYLMLTSGEDSDVGLWDIRNMSRKLHTFVGHNEAVGVVRWDPHSSTRFATGSNDRRVVVWDLSKTSDGKQILFIHGGHRSRVTDLSWCHSEASVVASTQEGSIVQVWQMTQSLLNAV